MWMEANGLSLTVASVPGMSWKRGKSSMAVCLLVAERANY